MEKVPAQAPPAELLDDQAVACTLCGLVQHLPPATRYQMVSCARCETPMARHKRNSLSRTMAFAIAALILYIPANLLPIMTFEYYGASEHNTVWSGVVSLAESGMWFVAAVVFIASMVAPLLKLSSLFLLAYSVRYGTGARWKTRLYRVIKVIGTWAMLDVFLLAVLVAVVKLGQLANVSPGPAALPFTLVVVFTILATESFDPSLLWHNERHTDRPS